MGASSWEIPNGHTAKQEALDDIRRNLNPGWEIVDHNFGPGDGPNAHRYGGFGNTLYVAVRDTDGTVSMHIRLFSAFTEHGARMIVAKDVDETMGASYYDAAARVMRRLTPTEHPEANQWRTEVTARAQKRIANRRKAKAAVGHTITLDRPVNYGRRLGELGVVEVVSESRWRDPATGSGLKPPTGWRDTLTFTINTDQPAA